MTTTALMTKMSELKFYGMQRAFQTTLETGQANRLTADEMLNYLIEAEWNDRQTRKLQRGLKNARFRYNASIEEVEYSEERKLDKNQIMRLADCSFIERKENVIITGSTGVGKSFFASALGHQACNKNYKVLYFNSKKLFSMLKLSKADNSYVKELAKIEKQNLLIIDDFGIHPIDAEMRLALLEIIEDRHGKNSTIITSQLPVSKWHELIGDSTIGDAILDRLVYTSQRIAISGPSMRKKMVKKLT